MEGACEEDNEGAEKEEEEGVEASFVVLSHAFADPWAMVVEAQDTGVAVRAVS